MKKCFVCILLVCCIALPSWSAEIKITESNLKKFIDIFPQYKSMAKKYTQQASSSIPPSVLHARNDFVTFFKRNNITPETFTALVEKITMGISFAQMKQQGIPMPQGMQLPGAENISDREVEIISNNLDKIMKVL